MSSEKNTLLPPKPGFEISPYTEAHYNNSPARFSLGESYAPSMLRATKINYMIEVRNLVQLLTAMINEGPDPEKEKSAKFKELASRYQKEIESTIRALDAEYDTLTENGKLSVIME